MIRRRSYPNLQMFLDKSGTSQSVLARRIGVNPSYISLILGGHRVPSLALAAKIADAANIPIESLLRIKTAGLRRAS